MFIEALEGGHYAPSSGSRAKPLVGLGVEAAKTFQLYSTCYEVEESWKYGNKKKSDKKVIQNIFAKLMTMIITN